MVTLVIGTGLIPEPNSGDEKFDEEAELAWGEFCMAPDITGLCHMGQLQRLIYASKLIDGEIFSIKTSDETGEPKLQLVESHRCAGKNYGDTLDGMTVDQFGRPDEYRMCLGTTSTGDVNRNGDAEMVLARDLVHHRYQLRAGEYRPLTAFKACLNTAHDVADILLLEKAAVKDACGKTDIIETKTGEADPQSKTTERFAINRTDSATNAAAAQLFYSKTFGPAAKYIRRGDKYTPYIPQRPSPAWQGLMDFLSANIAMPWGMPPSTLLQIKVGGADTRGYYSAAARVIQVHQYDFACELTPIYRYVVNSKLGGSGRPKNWARAEWHGPRPITCDLGRQGDSDRQDLAMGALAVQEYCATQETTMRKLFRQNALAKKLRAQIAQEEQVEPDDVFNFNYKAIQQPQPETAPSQASNE